MNRTFIIIAILFLAMCAMLWPHIPDDTYISLRYAQNLATGHGMTFNPGERVEGYSNFLWVLLCAGLFKLGYGVTACIVLGMMFGLLTLWLVFKESRDAAAVLALCVPFGMYAVAGLETMLFSFLLVCLIVYLRKQNWTVVFSCGIGLALCRPEGALVLPAALFWRAVTKRSPWKQAIVMATVFKVTLVGYHLWRWKYFGELLPAPFVSKCLSMTERWTINARFFFVEANDRFAPFGYFYVGLLALAILSAIRARKIPTALVVCVPLVGLYASVPDWMPAMRYFVPLVPLLLLSLDVKRFRVWLCALLVMAAMLGYHDRTTMAGHMGKVREMARWLSETRKPGDVLAMGDIGAVPYYTGMRTVDINPKPLARRAKFDYHELLAMKPDWVVIPSLTDYRNDSLRVYTEYIPMIQDTVFQSAVAETRVFKDMEDRCYYVFKMKAGH